MDISVSFFKKHREVKNKSSKRFSEWSASYDRSILQFLIFKKSHELFIKNIIQYDNISRVLDMGCGTGEFSLKLRSRKRDIDVYGVDISGKMIDIAKAKAEAGGIDVKFKVGDAENLPFEDNSFDCITCAHSFHHYPHKKKAIREMFRVLKNNGIVMIIDGCKDRVLGRFIFDFLVKTHEVDVHHLHSVQFHRLLTNVGFKDIVQKAFNPLIPLIFTKGVAKKEAVC